MVIHTNHMCERVWKLPHEVDKCYESYHMKWIGVMKVTIWQSQLEGELSRHQSHPSPHSSSLSTLKWRKALDLKAWKFLGKNLLFLVIFSTDQQHLLPSLCPAALSQAALSWVKKFYNPLAPATVLNSLLQFYNSLPPTPCPPTPPPCPPTPAPCPPLPPPCWVDNVHPLLHPRAFTFVQCLSCCCCSWP